jgi:vacuolar-type H+-ATPase subunit H
LHVAHQSEQTPSPLDEIQAAEAAVHRRIAAAQEAAERRIVDTQKEAAELRQVAQEAGQRAGQAQYTEAVQKANEAANALLAEAHKKGQEIRQKGEREMDALTDFAVSFVAGTGAKGE